MLSILPCTWWRCFLMIKDEMAPLFKSRSIRGNERGMKEHRTGSFYMSQSEHSDFNLPQVSDIKKECKWCPHDWVITVRNKNAVVPLHKFYYYYYYRTCSLLHFYEKLIHKITSDPISWPTKKWYLVSLYLPLLVSSECKWECAHILTYTHALT